MGVAILNRDDLGDEATKIGDRSHARRNWWVALGLIAGISAVSGYYGWTGRTDSRALGQLEAFRAAYAEQCEAPAFAAPAPQALKDLYLGSLPLRQAVDRQLAALSEGRSCEDVTKALRAADYPLPPPVPTITLQPGAR
jgi:hypothetical protein